MTVYGFDYVIKMTGCGDYDDMKLGSTYIRNNRMRSQSFYDWLFYSLSTTSKRENAVEQDDDIEWNLDWNRRIL